MVKLFSQCFGTKSCCMLIFSDTRWTRWLGSHSDFRFYFLKTWLKVGGGMILPYKRNSTVVSQWKHHLKCSSYGNSIECDHKTCDWQNGVFIRWRNQQFSWICLILQDIRIEQIEMCNTIIQYRGTVFMPLYCKVCNTNPVQSYAELHFEVKRLRRQSHCLGLYWQ